MGAGQQLRQARLARGVSLGDVFQRTRIPVKQLELVETEQYDRLPGAVFVRGYVRAMAGAVGLKPETVLAALREDLAGFEQATERGSAIAESGESPGEPRLRLAPDAALDSRRPARGLAVIVIGLAVLGGILWLGTRASSNGPAAATSAADRETPPLAETRPPLTPGAAAVGTAGKTTPAPTGSSSGLALVVEASRTCWVELTSDGERVAYRLLQPGERIATHVHDRATLRTGDAAALRLTIDGREARPIGSSGEVRTIEITPQNYRRVLGE